MYFEFLSNSFLLLMMNFKAKYRYTLEAISDTDLPFNMEEAYMRYRMTTNGKYE